MRLEELKNTKSMIRIVQCNNGNQVLRDYNIIFHRDYYSYGDLNLWKEIGDYSVHGSFDTLKEASAWRSLNGVSGDLVVDNNLDVIVDDSWLFDWEKNNEKSYAYQQIQIRMKGG